MSAAFLRFALHHPDDGDGLARFRIAAENTSFSSEILVWGYAESFADLAVALKGFPHTAASELAYELGASKAGYCKLHFVCIDGAGHPAVWISLESEYPVFPSAQHQTIQLCLRFEPAALDCFCSELSLLGKDQANEATLYGS